MLDALSESPIGRTTRSKRGQIESGEYPPNLALSLAAKDLRLVTEAAEKAGVDARVVAAAGLPTSKWPSAPAWASSTTRP